MCLPGHEVADGQHRESGRARRIGRGSNNFSAQDHGDPGFVGHLSRLVARFVAQVPYMATATWNRPHQGKGYLGTTIQYRRALKGIAPLTAF